ncbi:hypothetical protein [Sphingobium sufflavum]|uniref:hypothetical protein n=1 Tax=Sphingobium sufflavum TaxID=1129547 RepID=UPI001F193190|nr:hypothetical protein [Sphingobium sufflavum]
MCKLSKILPVVEQYLAITGTDAATFGQAVADAPSLVEKMKLGQLLAYGTVHSALDYMTAHLEALLADKEAVRLSDTVTEPWPLVVGAPGRPFLSFAEAAAHLPVPLAQPLPEGWAWVPIEDAMAMEEAA